MKCIRLALSAVLLLPALLPAARSAHAQSTDPTQNCVRRDDPDTPIGSSSDGQVTCSSNQQNSDPMGAPIYHPSFTGCEDSPENPTLVLALLAAGTVGIASLRKRLRSAR